MKRLLPLLFLFVATVAPGQGRAPSRLVPKAQDALRYVLVYETLANNGVVVAEDGKRTQLFRYEPKAFVFRGLDELEAIGERLAGEETPEGDVLVSADGSLGPIDAPCSEARTVAVYDLRNAKTVNVDFTTEDVQVVKKKRGMKAR